MSAKPFNCSTPRSLHEFIPFSTYSVPRFSAGGALIYGIGGLQKDRIILSARRDASLFAGDKSGSTQPVVKWMRGLAIGPSRRHDYEQGQVVSQFSPESYGIKCSHRRSVFFGEKKRILQEKPLPVLKEDLLSVTST